MKRPPGKTLAPLVGDFRTRVVGVTFAPDYPANLLRLRESAERRWLLAPADVFDGDLGPEPEPLPAVLIRAPANPHDADAIEVHVPEVGMIGHVPAGGDVAHRLARELDAGVVWQAAVDEVNISEAHPERPGIGLHCWRVS